MKYKVGDRVRIVSSWSNYWGQNTDGKMDHWQGQLMTIRVARYDDLYRMVEDASENGGVGWYWKECAIEGLANDEIEDDNEELDAFFDTLEVK